MKKFIEIISAIIAAIKAFWMPKHPDFEDMGVDNRYASEITEEPLTRSELSIYK